MMGGNWRPKFDPQAIRQELEIIRKDLHCNAVRIQGLDIDRLKAATQYALMQNLEVWFSPEMWDKSQEETLQYIIRAADEAESLRQRWPGKVVFSVGSELTLFMKGIVEGDNFFERMNNPSFWESIKVGKHNPPLNNFLKKASDHTRQAFHGPVTYFSVPLETVDWSPFDFVGTDLYRDARIKNNYGEIIRAYEIHKKPIIIGEFGCCTYRGAEILGGNGFFITVAMMEEYLGSSTNVLPANIGAMLRVMPRIDGHYVRDEDLQAQELADQLNVLDNAGVDGAFVFTFVSPNSLYNDDPKFDSDMGSFSLVKSFAEKETVDEFESQTVRQAKEFLGIDLDPTILSKFKGNVGMHGATYPDMPWEPKKSFRAVADYYAKH